MKQETIHSTYSDMCLSQAHIDREDTYLMYSAIGLDNNDGTRVHLLY